MVTAILHLGAHRCATSSFQAFLDHNTAALAARRTAVWTPQVTRAGLFAGLVRPPDDAGNGPDPRLAAALARVKDQLAMLDRGGFAQVLVSEENMIGSPRDNLARHALYPGARARLARFAAAFGDSITRVGLSIRRYDEFWASSLAYAVAQGHDVPSADSRARLAHDPRGWQAVIGDIRQAFPAAQLAVWPFETFASRTTHQFELVTDNPAAGLRRTPIWQNKSQSRQGLRQTLRQQGRTEMAAMLPSGQDRWMPFDDAQRLAMADRYAADLAWLDTLDDPFVTITEKAAHQVLPRRAITHPPHLTGENHHEQKQHMG